MDYVLLSAIYYGIIGELENPCGLKVRFSPFDADPNHIHGMLIDVRYSEPEMLKEFGISKVVDMHDLKMIEERNKSIGAANEGRDMCFTIGRELGIKLQQGLEVAIQQQRETWLAQQPR